ncbi:MAG: formylmethanofuran dehydrogenase [Clostridia bacterium]|nr:formylmethanofuran dehydrogenase [Clostridia bacterium]
MDHWEQAIALHGHACCLLAVGYRAAEVALGEFAQMGIATDDLAAIVENRTCAVDAIQAVCRTTLGNGRLRVRDSGKYVFTIGNPKSGKGVRVALKAGILSRPGPEFTALMERVANQEADAEERARFYAWQEPLMRFLLEAGAEEIFEVAPVDFSFSRERLGLVTAVCDRCGEEVATVYIRQLAGGEMLCPACAQASTND